MPVWPATLPFPTISTMQGKTASNAIRSSMDKGPAKVRRRTTANVKPRTFSIFCTEAQLETLESFYDNDTFSGSEAFNYTDPRNNEVISCRFTAEIDWAEKEGIDLYQVNVALEILP